MKILNMSICQNFYVCALVIITSITKKLLWNNVRFKLQLSKISNLLFSFGAQIKLLDKIVWMVPESFFGLLENFQFFDEITWFYFELQAQTIDKLFVVFRIAKVTFFKICCILKCLQKPKFNLVKYSEELLPTI